MIPNDLPISFRIPMPEFHLVRNWLAENNMYESVLLDWAKSTVWFYDRQDAMAFYLKFGMSKVENKIEQMLKNA
ncbi:MAG TPA: hypothetical protein VIY47_15080 [Ignavibacteriaceae bacterium]